MIETKNQYGLWSSQFQLIKSLFTTTITVDAVNFCTFIWNEIIMADNETDIYSVAVRWSRS